MPVDGVKDTPDQRLSLLIPGEALAVRDGLRALFDTLLLRTLPEGARGAAELVLAEALNNIVEHAYAAAPGQIELTLERTDGGLVCRIVDHGRPMPGEALPEGRAPAANAVADPADLPEGGWGWGLIRALAQDLHYARRDGQNHLSFRLASTGDAEQS